MTVLSAIGSVALLLMLLYLPGAAAAAMLVRRPLSVLAAAPAAGYAMYSVGAMVTTAAGIRWTPAAVAGWLVICLVVVALGAVAAGMAACSPASGVVVAGSAGCHAMLGRDRIVEPQGRVLLVERGLDLPTLVIKCST